MASCHNGIDYTRLPALEIERLARVIAPGAWGVERQRPLATLLGSCVSVCLYDLKAGIGGINHFMLPSLLRSRHREMDVLLAGDFAMEALLNALLQQGVKKASLQAKAFGGGTMMATGNHDGLSIGMRNARFAQEWLEREGIPLVATSLLGPWARKILFVPGNGDVWCRRMPTHLATVQQIGREEARYAATLETTLGSSKTATPPASDRKSSAPRQPATVPAGPPKVELF